MTNTMLTIPNYRPPHTYQPEMQSARHRPQKQPKQNQMSDINGDLKIRVHPSYRERDLYFEKHTNIQ